MVKRLILLFAALFMLFSENAKSQAIELSDSAEVSVLTNSPWLGAIYGLFGHASIRVKDPGRHLDFVFNYGMFSFQKPNFIYHFAKGETDYMVAPIPYPEFILEYKEKGLEVSEQVVRLSRRDKQKVWNALCINVLPENREYRYNFFFDNCATRPFEMIEKNISGKIILPEARNNPTFRNLLNEFLEGNDWTQFGINLVVGGSADRHVTEREKIFLPKYLHQVLSKSVICDSTGIAQPLVISESILTPKVEQPKESTWVSPWVVGLLLLLVAAILSYRQWRSGEPSLCAKLFDSLLFALAGVAGLVLTFLMFFSVHPCMFPNWNYVWLHPLHLLAACLFYVKSCTKFIYYYHFINFALLTVFLLAWKLIPQELEWSFLPYVGTLWLRCMIGAFATTKR